MSRSAAGLLLSAQLALGCAVMPPSPSVPSQTDFRGVNGSAVYEDWPAVARRPWPDVGPNGMPAGFIDEQVLTDLQAPTAVRFLPDGQLVVTEQAGLVKAFPATDVDEARVVLDLRAEVLLNRQIGLLGFAIDPEFDTEPYLYLAYTRDAPLGGDTPTYGSPDGNDDCPSRFACPASGRLVRYHVARNPLAVDGPPQVLIDDWCIVGRNHTVGAIQFAADGALLVSGGDGANGDEVDHGQLAENSCADPDGESGSMRSQDLAFGSDPVGLNGTIARVDRATGEALADNPLAGAGDENARRIIAHGLRNPFRFTLRPGTDELWIADVGWMLFEEINVMPVLAPSAVNFGWPCFEGPAAQPTWHEVAAETCAEVSADGADVMPPRLAFGRGQEGEAPCESASAATSAIAFYEGSQFPEQFHGALFFADAQQACLYVIELGSDGQPDPGTVRRFAHPVQTSDLVVGPDGALYYTDLARGQIRRIAWRR